MASISKALVGLLPAVQDLWTSKMRKDGIEVGDFEIDGEIFSGRRGKSLERRYGLCGILAMALFCVT